MPLLSIITVNYNSIDGLRSTINSVLSQTNTNIKHIVIDGNSTDGSIELLKAYSDRILWISEPDLGIYDAMNKGIGLATGDYLYFLNAGDLLYDVNTVSHVVEQLTAKRPDLLYGDTSVINESLEEISYIDNSLIDNLSILITAVNHQSIIVSKSLFVRFGLYDLRLKIKADHDWFLRVYRKRKELEFTYIKMPVVKYLSGGFSSSARYKYVVNERRELVSRHASLLGRAVYKLLSSLSSLEKGSYLRGVCNSMIFKS